MSASSLLLAIVLFNREVEAGVAFICLARIQECIRLLPFVIGAVWVRLCLQAHGTPLPVADASFALHCAVEEIAGINLHSRLGGENLHHDACGGACQPCAGFLHAAAGVQQPVVVVALSILQLFVLKPDVAPDGLRRA